MFVFPSVSEFEQQLDSTNTTQAHFKEVNCFSETNDPTTYKQTRGE